MKLGNILDYVERILGLDCSFHAEDPSEHDGISNIHRMTFDIVNVAIGGIECCLASPFESSISTSTLIGRAAKLKATTNKPCVIVLDSIDSVMRRQMITRKQPFIVAGKQLYLPFIGAMLSERGLGHVESIIAISPSTQLVILYHLLKERLDGVPLKVLAGMTGYSNKTASLTASELSSAGLCETVSGYANTKSLHFKIDGRQLWDAAYPLLKSPIKRVMYMAKEQFKYYDHLAYTYDQALSHYTDISDMDYESYAVEDKLFRCNDDIHVSTSYFPGSVRLELWKYDPTLLARNGYIDPLSMALCYKDDDDDRVRAEIDMLIERTL